MPTINFDLTKLKITTGFVAFLFFFVSVVAGAVVIFVFNRELFLQLSWFKLLLISLAISSPIVIINGIIAALFNVTFLFFQKKLNSGEAKTGYDSGFEIGLIIGSVFCIPILYVPVILEHFLRLGWLPAIGEVGVLEAVSFFAIRKIFKILLDGAIKMKENQDSPE